MSGFYEGSDLADKTFYGFRLNLDTGHLNVEIIGPTDGSVVALPQDNLFDKDDYRKLIGQAKSFLAGKSRREESGHPPD